MRLFYAFSYSIIWAVLIFIISVIPKNNLPESDISHIDFPVHVALYAILAYLILTGVRKYDKVINVRHLIKTTLFSGVYGMILEFIQPIVSDRASEFSDFLANFIGASIGAGLMILFKKTTYYD